MRLLASLAHTGHRVVERSEGTTLIDARGVATPLATEHVATLVGRGLVETRDGAIIISAAGRALLRRSLAEVDPFQAQHQAREQVTMTDSAGAVAQVTRNRAESPLAWLRSRRGPDGKPLVDAAEFEAGERLRADFTRGNMMPGITTNWSMVGRGAPGRSSGGADMTEAALSARMRVERALDAVGPELAGALLDVCCFLKRIEEVEQQHAWPARSGKVVLRLALAVLARHYGISASATGAERRRILHWGAAGYRPRVD